MNMRKDTYSPGQTSPDVRLKPVSQSIRLALLPGLLFGLSPDDVSAAPTGGKVKAGTASIVQNNSGTLTTINQASQRAAIDWTSFNVNRGELVNFKQPNAKASTLNRIFDQRPSEIFGQVKADGRVVLMNPNGVFFKPGSQVNVGSLIAGAMQIGIDDFMSGRYKLNAMAGTKGRVINEGHLEAAEGGDVTLVGQSVANRGVIVATAGKVNLVAGDQVTVDFDGDGLLRFAVDKEVVDNATAIDDQIENSGDILAEGGDVLMTASAAEGVFKNAINNSGVVRAGSIQNKAGRIMLVGMGAGSNVLNTGTLDASAVEGIASGGEVSITGGNIQHDGVIDVSATQGDGGTVSLESIDTTLAAGSIFADSGAGQGGEVKVLGNTVGLNYAASIDASGATAGGEVLIGGDYQGRNADVKNAQRTFIGTNATVRADATDTGNGGRVIVWADDHTTFAGQISARGGATDGDGGFAEVSGKNTLAYTGHVDLTATNGSSGTLLLDPGDLTVQDAPIDLAGTPDHLDDDLDADAGHDIQDTDNGTNASTITWEAINAEVDNDVIIATTGRITFEDVDTATTVTTVGGAVNLTFSTGSLTFVTDGTNGTDGEIIFSDPTDTVNISGGDLTFTTDADGRLVGANFTTSGGNLNFNLGSGASSFGSVDVGGGTFTIDVAAAGTVTQSGAISGAGGALMKAGDGTLTLSQANTYSGATTVSAGSVVMSGAGSIATSSGLDLDTSGATFNLNGVDQSIVKLDGVAGSIVTNSHAGTSTNTLTITGDGGVFSGSLTDGKAQGTDGSDDLLAITKSTAGTQTLSAAVGDFEGAINVTGGTLKMTTTQSFGNVTGTTSVNGGTLELALPDATTLTEVLTIEGTGDGGAGALVASTTGTITLDSAASPLTLSNDATISADDGGAGTAVLDINDQITGTAQLTTAGADIVRISDTGNDYIGNTVISAGTLQLGGAGVIADGSAVTITGTLDLDDNSETVGSIAGAGTITNSGSGAATLTAGGDNSDTVFSGIIEDGTGTGTALTKEGTGDLTLSGANTYSGQTNVNNGEIIAQNNDAFGTNAGGPGVDDTVVGTMGLVRLGTLTTSEDFNLSGNGGGALIAGTTSTVVVNGDIALSSNVSIIGASTMPGLLTINGVISGGFDLTYGGFVEVTNANTYTGSTNVNSGILTVTDSAGLGTTAAGTFVQGGSTLEFDIAAGATVSEAITLGLGVESATPKLLHSAANTLELDGGLTTSLGNTSDNVEISVADDAAGEIRITTVGVTGPHPIEKTGDGTLTIETDNAATLTGADSDITVAAGTLKITDDAALGDLNGETFVTAGTLELALPAASVLNEVLTIEGTGDGGVGALVASTTGNIQLDSASSLTLSNDATISADDGGGGTAILAINDDITGAFNLTKVGADVLALTAANSYTGTTTITEGEIQVSNDAALSSVLVMNDTNTSVLDLLDRTINLTSLTTTGSGAGSATVRSDSGAGSLELDTSGGGFTFDGDITDNGGTVALTKQGANTLTLSGSNDYSGATTVSAGTLQAGAAGGFSANSAYTLNGTSVLDVNDLTTTVGSIASASGTATITLGSGTLTAGGDDSSTSYDGDITGSGGLTKAGSGTLTLASATAYTGTTTIDDGEIELGDAGAISSVVVMDMNAGDASVLDLQNFTVNLTSLTSTNAGGTATVTSDNAGGATLELDTSGGGFSFAGDIDDGAGAVALTKQGANTLTLSGSNDYSGATTVSDGTLEAGSATGFSANSAVTLSAAGSTLDVNGLSVTIDSLSGGTGVLDMGADDVTDSTLTATNDLTLTGMTVNFGTGGNDTLDAGGTLTTPAGATSKADGGNLTLRGVTSIVLGNTVSAGGGTLLFDGDGTTLLNMSGVSTGLTVEGTSTAGAGSITGGLTANFTDIGAVTGGSGTDTLTIASGTAVTFVVDGASTGTVDFLDGSGTQRWTDFENLVGNDQADFFTFTNGTITGDAIGNGAIDTFTVNGGGASGANELQGNAGDDVFVFSADGTMFTGDVYGDDNPAVNSADANSFTFTGRAHIVGTLDGGKEGGGADNDTLDASGSTIANTYNSGNGSFTLVAPETLLLVSNNATDVDYTAPSGLSIFSSPYADSYWVIEGVDTGAVAPTLLDLHDYLDSGGGTFTTFTGVLAITGGSGIDAFFVASGGSLTAAADGGLGTNTLQGGIGATVDQFTINGTSDVVVDVDGATATFSSILNLDASFGDAHATLIDAGGDTFDLNGNTWGGAINGGAGTNALLGLTGTTTVTTANTGTAGSVTGGWSNIQELTGTAAMETFTFQAGSSVSSLTSLGGGDAIDVTGAVSIGTLTTLAGDTVTLNGGSTLTLDDGSVAGDITGGGALQKVTAGTLVLSGTNAYTGLTTLTAGTLVLAGASNDAIGAGSQVDVNGGSLQIDASEALGVVNSTAGGIDLNGGGVTLTIDSGDLDGVVSGAGGLTKASAGTLSLDGANTYTGLTTVAGGTLQISNNASLGGTGTGTTIDGGNGVDSTLEITAAGNLTLGEAITFVNDGANEARLLSSPVTGTSTLTNGVTFTSDGTVEVATGGTLDVTTTAMDGAGTLRKTGAGTLLLSVAGSTMDVDLQAGILAIGVANALDTTTDLTLATSTTFNLNGLDQTIRSLSGVAGAVVTNDDGVIGNNNIATLTLADGGGATYSGNITQTGDDDLSIIKSGAGTQTFSVATGSYAGALTVSGGVLETTTAASFGTAAGGTLIDATAAAATLELSTNMAVGDSVRFVNNTNVATLLDSVGSGTTTLNGGVVMTSDGTIDVNTGGTLDVATIGVSGAGALTKVDAGTLIFSAASTATGLVTVNGGTLAAGVTDAIATHNGLTLGAAGTFDVNGLDQTIATFDGVGGAVVTNDGGALATLEIQGAGTFAGVLQDGVNNLALTKSTAGTLILSGTNTYAGATTVSGGTLELGASDVIDNASSLVVSGGVFDLGGFSDTVAGVQLTSGSITNGDLTSNAAYDMQAGSASANLAGTLGLNKTTVGTVFLSGTNTYTGNTTVTAGTLVLAGASNDAIGAGSQVDVNGGSLRIDANEALGVVNSTSGGIDLNGVGVTLTIDSGDLNGVVSGAGALTKTSVGTLSLDGANTYAGATLVDNGTLQVSTSTALGTNAGATTLDATNNSVVLEILSPLLTINEDFNLNNGGANTAEILASYVGGTTTLSGTVSLNAAAEFDVTDATSTLAISSALAGTGALTKEGAGTLLLSAASGHTGATDINAGTIQAGAADVLSASSGLLLTGTGVFDLNDTDQTIATLNSAANTTAVTNSGVGTATLTVNNGGTFDGQLTESLLGTLALTAAGGTLQLSNGTNDFTGLTTISAGELEATGADVLTQSSGVSLTAPGATFDLNGHSQAINDLNGVAGTTVTNNAAGNPTLTVNGTGTMAGNGTESTGTLALTKDTSAGILTLSGSNDYSGATNIMAGTLRSGSNTSIGDASDVTLFAGAILDINNFSESIGSLGGGAGTLDLGLGNLDAADDINLTGMTVTIAAAGSDNQTIKAGTDGTGTLTTDGLVKLSAGNLTLGGPTAIDLNGTVDVNGGNIVLEDNFSLAGDMTASGLIDLSTVTGTIDGVAAQLIDAEGGTLVTAGLTQSGAGDMDLTLDAAGGITATADINVQTAGDSLILAATVSTDSNLVANQDVDFQSAGTYAFTDTADQSVTATNGVITNNAAAVLSKTAGGDLVLTSGTGIGNVSALDVIVAGGGGLRAASTIGGSIDIASSADLRVDGLETGTADTVTILTTGDLVMDGADGYTSLADDTLGLDADGDITFQTTALTVTNLVADFGRDGTAHVVNFNSGVTATTVMNINGNDGADIFNVNEAIGTAGTSTFNGGLGNDQFIFGDTFTVDNINGQGGANDVIDLSTYTGAVTFTATGVNAGNISGAMTSSYATTENLIGGLSPNDTFSGGAVAADNTFTVTGADQGTTSLLTGTGPSWQAIENLQGSSAGNDTFFIDDATLSGTIDGAAHPGSGDSLSYALHSTNVAVTLDAGANTATATNVTGSVSGIENYIGSSVVGNDTFTGRSDAGTTANWTIDSDGSTEEVSDSFTGLTSTFIGFEVLQGGSGIDTFTINDTTDDFDQIKGGDGNDNLFILGNNTVLTVANGIFMEGGDDVVRFGDTVTEANPPTPDDTNEHARFVGSIIDLGTSAGDNDTLDYSPSDLFQTQDDLLKTITDAAGNTGLAGLNEPDVDLIGGGGTFANAEIIIGNGSQFKGIDANQVWVVTATGTFRVAADYTTALAAPNNLNFSILAGNQTDVFVFQDIGTTTPQLPLGLDAGAGADYLIGSFDTTAATGDGTGNGDGADIFTVGGLTSVNVTINGNTGSLTTIGTNIEHIGDPGAGNATVDAMLTTISEDGSDTVNFNPDVTFGGDIFGNGGVNNVLNLTGHTGTVTATIDASSDTMTSANPTFASSFVGFSTLNLGTVADTITFTAFPTAGNTVTVNGNGGIDALIAPATIDPQSWTLTANNTGTVSGTGLGDVSFISFENAETNATDGNGNTAIWDFAGFSLAGTITDNVTISGAAPASTFGALGVRIDGNVALTGATNSLTSTNADILIDGNLTSANNLAVSSGAGDFAVGGAMTTGAGASSVTAATTTIGGGLTTGGAFTANTTGDFTVGDNLDIGGGTPAALSVDAGANSISVGTIDSAAATLAGTGGVNAGTTNTNGGDLAVNAGGGGATFAGPITTAGGNVSIAGSGTHSVGAVDSGAGNQTYSGTAQLRGDLTGQNLVFNNVVIASDVDMRSSTAVFDFNGVVTSSTAPVLNIIPPPETDMFIDLVDGPGHINANAFENFDGTLSIGGLFTPGGASVLDGSIDEAPADHIQISEDFITGGDIILVGSAIDFAPASGDLEIAAGPAGGTGEFALFAVGNSIIGSNDGIQPDGQSLGDIGAPDGSQRITFTGGSATLSATNAIVNSTNMIMNLGGGGVSVAQSDAQQVDFNVQSNATESGINLTGTNLLASLAQLAGFSAADGLFQNARVFFPNPAAVLTILQSVSFVDASLFETELSLFGQIGNGIALSLDQCEEAEGCAPSVTLEELDGFIEVLNDRISRLETLMGSGEMSAEQGNPLLDGYRQQLQNFLSYRTDLVEYLAQQEADEFGDDFGDEFDDVFEAEESFDDAGDVVDEPAVEEPIEFEEPAEETFEELEEIVEEPAVEAEPETFEDLDEDLEAFEELPDVIEEPAAPVEELDAAPEEFDDGEFEELEFEELEEELDDSLLNDAFGTRNINQLLGSVRIDTNGNIVWTGDVVLPTLHRRF